MNKNKKTLLIAIDANEANIQNRVGVNQFAFEVVWGIYKLNKIEKQKHNFRIFLKDRPLADLPTETSWWQYETFGPKLFWTRTGLVKRLFFRKPKPDVLFSPSHYGPGISPIPYVISIMDLGFLKFKNQFTSKDLYQLKSWTKQSVKKSKKIIAISKFTKKDIIANYQVEKDKVIVAHPGFTKTKASTEILSNSAKNILDIKSDYLLYLGTMKPSKNIEGLIKAYNILFSENKIKNTKLVIAGKKGWLYQSIYNLVKELDLEKHVIFTGFVSDSEAEKLIKNAKAFVMVSFWEGFGIPVLEAMSLGVPVICSNAGSLPEITNKTAILVDPKNHKQIAQEIERILNDKQLRTALIKKGKARAKVFDWQNCSKIILDTVISVANKKN